MAASGVHDRRRDVSVWCRQSARGARTGDGHQDLGGVPERAAPALSLKALGLLDQPSAPILGVNGKPDDQAPVQDIYLLMEHGSPKEARIYPQGRHMGRTPDRPEQEIWEMIATWLKDKLTK